MFAVNLAVKFSLKDIHAKISSIRKFVASVKTSVERRDAFQNFKISLKMGHVTIPSLHVDMRWSSTFDMIEKARKARRVLNAMCVSYADLGAIRITDHEWATSITVCNLLKLAAKFTKNQRRQSHATLSLTVTGYRMLIQHCQDFIEAYQGRLRDIGPKMLTKLKAYDESVSTSSHNWQNLDPRFPSNALSDDVFLLPDLQNSYPDQSHNSSTPRNKTSNFRCFRLRYSFRSLWRSVKSFASNLDPSWRIRPIGIVENQPESLSPCCNASKGRACSTGVLCCKPARIPLQ